MFDDTRYDDDLPSTPLSQREEVKYPSPRSPESPSEHPSIAKRTPPSAAAGSKRRRAQEEFTPDTDDGTRSQTRGRYEAADAFEEDQRLRLRIEAELTRHQQNKRAEREDVEAGEIEQLRAKMAGLTTEEYRGGFVASPEMESTIRESDALIQLYEKSFKDDRREIMGMNWEELIHSKSEQKKETCIGDIRIREFMYYIRTAKMDRYAPQMETVRAALASLAPQMFGKDFQTHRERLAKEYDITDTRSQLLVIMARRNGKTQIASVIEAAAQVVMQGITAIFAAVFQQASDLMQLIHGRVMEFTSKLKGVVRVKNAKKLEYDFNDGKDKKIPFGIVRCFSGSKVSARGFKADRIYFDEASFASPDFITKNVFAGMLLVHVFVMLFSSPPEDTNHIFARMFTSTSARTGERHFKTLQLDHMCDDCRSRKYMKCPHVRPPNASWLASEADMALIKDVMMNIDEKAYRQEILGQLGDNDTNVFSPTNVDDFERLPKVKFDKPPQYVLVGVDTSGSGRSETAVFAMALDGDKNHVILGLETFEQNSNIQEEAQIVGFLSRLAKDNKLVGKDTQYMFFVESNCGGPSRAASIYQNIIDWAFSKSIVIHAVCDDSTAQNRPGFWLTAQKKEKMAIYTRRMLDEKKLRVHESFCTRSPDIMQKLTRQMRNYKRMNRPQSARSYLSSDSRIQYVYSGKGGAQNDDLCVIMQEVVMMLPIMMGKHQKSFIYIPPKRTLDEQMYINTLKGSVFYHDRRDDGRHAIGAPNMASVELRRPYGDTEMVDVGAIDDNDDSIMDDYVPVNHWH